MAATIGVLAVGSPFGDDALGWRAAERLKPVVRLLPAGRVVVSVLDRPGALLLSAWRDAERIILIDAVRGGRPPGTLYRLAGEALAQPAEPLSSHDFGVGAAVALAAALGEDPARLVLHGIEPDLGWQGRGLSPAVEAALPRLVRRIETELHANILAGTSVFFT